MHASLYGRGTVLKPVINSTTYPVKYERALSWWNKEMGMNKIGEREIPVLESIAVVNNNDLTIFAVNKDQNHSLDFTCEMRGFEEYKVLEHIIMEHKDLKAKNTASNPDNVKPHSNGDAKIKSSKIIATLPL